MATIRKNRFSIMYFYIACGIWFLYIVSALIAPVLESSECKEARQLNSAGLINNSAVDLLCDGKYTGEPK